MRNPVIYIIIIAAIFFVACSRKPQYVVSEAKMTDILYDIQLAQSIFRMNGSFSSDEKKDAVIAGILEKHGITQEELDSSLVWYSDNIEDYITINDTVTSRLKANFDKLSAMRADMQSSMRNWSKYMIPPFFYLTESSPLLSFTIDSTKIKDLNLDKFNISFDVFGLNDTHEVETGIYYTYQDTLVKNISPIVNNTHIVLKKPELPDSLLKGVSGYVYLRNKTKNITSDVLLYNISYSDSLPIGTQDSITGLERVPVIEKDVHPRLRKERDSLKTIKPELKELPKTEDDDTPIISRDEIIDNPLLNKKRQ